MAAVKIEKLKQVVDRGLKDSSYAERIFSDPDGVAREHGLSDDEKLVLKQMDRKRFDTARDDAAQEAKRAQGGELKDSELAKVAGGGLELSGPTLGTAADMIIGRSILGVTGTSYMNLTAACDCCAWKGAFVAGGTLTRF